MDRKKSDIIEIMLIIGLCFANIVESNKIYLFNSLLIISYVIYFRLVKPILVRNKFKNEILTVKQYGIMLNYIIILVIILILGSRLLINVRTNGALEFEQISFNKFSSMIFFGTIVSISIFLLVSYLINIRNKANIYKEGFLLRDAKLIAWTNIKNVRRSSSGNIIKYKIFTKNKIDNFNIKLDINENDKFIELLLEHKIKVN
ncbi:hypothetical protein [Clostridium sp. C8]|uniref:Uncharacterized protein n=1 Tax=bioreactor metagenome TaxID=1076179 RepID=A0A645C7N0_9ZZZZ|nr:hypothetical protein [Clostridium sp. C8]KLE14779.1 hypothetical protein AAT22_14950 [Clostridium sp. C8]